MFWSSKFPKRGREIEAEKGRKRKMGGEKDDKKGDTQGDFFFLLSECFECE